MFDEILYPYTDYNCTDLTLNLSDMILKLDVKCCPNKYDKYNDVIYGVFPYVTQPENDTSLNYIFKRTRWAFPSNRFTWPLLEQWNEWQTNSVISNVC